jgi:hypothetical protein
MSDDVRDVFVGTGAFVGSIDSDTRCSFWPTDPRDLAYAENKLIAIDLANTNSAVSRRVVTGTVELDGPKSTLGPKWPLGPHFVGRLYLHDEFIAKLPPEAVPPNPPIDAPGRPYEFLLVVYKAGTKNPRAGRRYQGVHADVIAAHGTVLELDVFDPGRSLDPDCERKRLSVDVATYDTCDPPPSDSGVLIGVGATAGMQGQIFVAENRVFEIFRSHPKLPPFLGTRKQP